MPKCPKCGVDVEDGAKFCAECGAAIPQTKECPKCHAQLKPNAKFCSECGYSFAGKPAGGGGLSMGDKNVIAGDVIGQKEDYHVSGNATFIKNEDETKKMVQCHICGKNLPIAGAFTCPECHEITCENCYDADRGLCVRCAEAADVQKESEYRSALGKVYADGRVEMSERRELDALKKKLGISDERATAMEAEFKTSASSNDGLGSFERMYCEQAREMLLGSGDAAAALKALESVYAKHPHDETVLGVYLPALAIADAKRAIKTMDTLDVDTESVAITRIDMALRANDLVTAEAKIKTAQSLWPNNGALRIRELLCHYMAYVKFHKTDALESALSILKALPAPTDKLSRSYAYYVKSLLATDLSDGFQQAERDAFSKDGIYPALTNGILFGIKPVLVDELVKRCSTAMEAGKEPLEFSSEELRVLKSAAAKKEPGSSYILGIHLLRSGKEREKDEGLRFVRFAAEAGIAGAQYALGNYESSNDGNLLEAPGWYRKAAEQGYAPAVAKVSELDKAYKANQKALAEKQAAAEKARKQQEQEAEFAAAASLRALLKDGMIKIPGTEIMIAKTQVTQALWKCIMGENPSHFKGDDRPVENLSLSDCDEFINKLNEHADVIAAKMKYRLPTFKEWQSVATDEKVLIEGGEKWPGYDCVDGIDGEWVEKGASIVRIKSTGKERDVLSPCASVWHEDMGWSGGKWHFGYMQYSPCRSTAWCWENSNRETHTVAQKKPNKLGLYDMFGNVAEWCSGGYCVGGCFLTECEKCSEIDRYGENAKSPTIGVRLVAFRV